MPTTSQNSRTVALAKDRRPRLEHPLHADHVAAGAEIVTTATFRTTAGLWVLLFASAAFVAPPFSGLDTLPSMGAVIIALSIILEDIALFGIGLVVGGVGLGLIAATISVITTIFKHLF